MALSELLAPPDLVFGLVGPIGVDITAVQKEIANALQQVGYRTETIHISKLVDKHIADIKKDENRTTLERKINKANFLCEVAENGAALVALAVAEIVGLREAADSRTSSGPKQGVAYVIRQLKRKEEADFLRTIYGDKFIQVSITLDKESRVERLKTRISAEQAGLAIQRCEERARHLVEVDESEIDEEGKSKKFGQELGRVFHLGDFFVNTADQSKISEKITRFIRALFGDNKASPKKDEFGAFTAASAAIRSVDLSRQVGAAIFRQTGEVVAVGCNEVPRFGGGNYWADDEFRARDIELGSESNSIEKQRIITDFIERLSKAKLLQKGIDLTQGQPRERLQKAVDEALISDITEYGRMTHAEMSAILDAARLGLPLKDTTMYVTTFPCHNCAKHIVAAGITRVVYIEPYPKSRAERSHKDSISMDRRVEDRVTFEHFEGISPARYQDIFRKESKRRKGSEIMDWHQEFPSPRISDLDPSHLKRENLATSVLVPILALKA